MTLIKLTNDHYIIVDDSEIKEGDLCYDPEGSPGYNNIKYVVKCLRTASDSYWNKHCKKITHSTQPIEANSLHRKYDFININPISLSEVKDLIGEVDIEKKSYDILKGFVITKEERRYFELGYTKAIEDNKEKKYTEEDLITFGIRVTSEAFSIIDGKGYVDMKKFDKILQSIHKTSWEVEIIDDKLKLK